MSFEGFYEYLCERGHYFARDVYDADPKECPRCRSAIEWRHQVDQTNGYDEAYPGTCCAPKAIKGTSDVWHEDHYGNPFAEELKEFEPAPGSAWGRVGGKPRKPRHSTFAKALGK